MSEIGQHRIQDPEVAYHMAHAEAPHRAAANEAAEKVLQKVTETHFEPASSTEQVLQEAEINKLINDSAYVISLRTVGQTDIRHDIPSERSLAPFKKMSEVLAEREARIGVREKGLNQAGVSEAVTVLPWPQKNLAVVNYTTLASSTESPYRYHPAGDNRGGQHMSFNLALKPEDAERLVGSVKQNPQLIRDMAEKLARTQVTEEQWLDARPPYEEWAEVNGGVNRVAFLTPNTQAPAEREIVEF